MGGGGNGVLPCYGLPTFLIIQIIALLYIIITIIVIITREEMMIIILLKIKNAIVIVIIKDKTGLLASVAFCINHTLLQQGAF